MVNYNLTRIYKLTCDDPELIFYGACALKYLSKKLAKHLSDWKNKNTYVSAHELFEVGNVKIEFVENFPCNNIEELNVKLASVIKNNKCVNIVHLKRKH
jgi:hypothetical protein